MSTRSIIGTTDETTYDGIYCHYDGYPSGMVPALAEIIVRDGAEALPVLSGRESRASGGPTTSWSSVVPEMPAPTTKLPYPDRETYYDKVPPDKRDPGIESLYVHLDMCRKNGRDRVIEGYGTVQTMHPMRYSGILGGAEVDFDIQWVYLFTDDLTLIVFEGTEPIMEVGRFTYDDLVAITAEGDAIMKRLSQAECGEDYSRCCHVVWAHVKDVPKASKNLSMQEWIGSRPLNPMSAIGAVVNGRRYEFTGSGGTRHGKWEVSVKGQQAMVPMFSQKRNEFTPLPGVELIYPPTRADATG